ncbi:type II secretion system F family protein [Massilia sp. CFBP9012]|uniref:Type II secretion system F family protein n=1 Tax=Massilia arenae TaxID=2603288 RepID=A0A5C7G4M0_9BURK|nr:MULTISPECIES: type II secretion system F family protein [Massilia]MDY0977224.1 type II secretion system F family protein [Massilia sp. CFBP9012]TXF99532.1 type II secretion system F family protein [Massilia arenae]
MNPFVIALLVGAAFVLLAAALIHGAVRLKEDVPEEDRAYLDPLPRPLRLLWPVVRLVDYHLCRNIPKSLLAGPGETLRLSGMLYLMNPTQFIALCLVSLTLFSGFTALVLSMAGLFNPFWVIALAGLGFIYPRIWLKETLKRRQKLIVKALPAYLDFLTMSVEAGLNMAGAIAQAVDKGPAGPLKNEFAFVLRDLRAGLTRADALRRMDARVRIPQVSSFISAVIQAERMGASLGATFRAQSEQRRVERFQLAEKLAMEAPVKLIFPLVVFIFPVTFLVLMFPIAMKFMASGIKF